MTYFYLIRHATNDLVSKAIAGWKPEVHLNTEGLAQADRLAQRLRQSGIRRVYSSPLERTQETAAPVGRLLGLQVQTAPEIGEVQFGDWTGKSLIDLESDPHWHQWDKLRSGCRPPNGETLIEVQCRVVTFIQKLCKTFPAETIALVSHGDPIRTALLYYLGMPLDFVQRLEISPASTSLLALSDDSVQVLSINQVD